MAAYARNVSLYIINYSFFGNVLREGDSCRLPVNIVADELEEMEGERRERTVKRVSSSSSFSWKWKMDYFLWQ